MSNVIDSWKKVFSNWRYSLIALIIALVFYEINVFLMEYQFLLPLVSSGKVLEALESFIALSLPLFRVLKPLSFFSLIITSVLVGTLFSLIAYKTNSLKSESSRIGALTTLGIFLGILAPGCAACGIGIVSAIGLSGVFLSFLPFRGLELSIVAIVLLLFANWKISKDIGECKLCKIK